MAMVAHESENCRGKCGVCHLRRGVRSVPARFWPGTSFQRTEPNRLPDRTAKLILVSLQTSRYALGACLGAALEAFSMQNDNLTLPLYMWTMLVFVGI